ncbi:MAG TPA: M1 family aminopeptidase, partial [Novosphingobium sp.]|nr:M1 family aminopeptidase [Novosphingobium sp.]
TQFESIDARSAFPGFDQPGYKQPFTVTLRTPAGLTAVSNAPEAGLAHENGADVHRFAATAPLPTYLLAMMVGPFATAQGQVPATAQRAMPLPLRIVSPRPNADKLTFALENTKPILALLEDYFGQSFPYPKLDQITAPIMAGAMENAGADLYMDSMIVLDDHAPTAARRLFGMVVGHELSHQWFGDLVTPKWWDDIWLNESFANWMGFRIGQAWRPDLNIAGGALAEGFEAMDIDALSAGRPIHQTNLTNAQIDAAFDRITYGKGGHVVAMIAAYMGDTAFRDGVRRYMAAHRYGNATSTDFFAALAEVAHSPEILPSMKSFVDEQGVPLLAFSPTGVAGEYRVALARYRRLGDTQATPARWLVPMCWRSGADGGGAGDDASRQCRMVGPEGATIQAQGVFMPNAGGTGYYRFSLPTAAWDRLIASADRLPAGEAQALADSLLGEFQAGRASAGQMADMARVMSHNPDSYAFEAATSGLAMLSEGGFLDGGALAAWRGFVGELMRPMLADVGFDPRAGAYAGEAPERSQRRLRIVGQLMQSAQDRTIASRLSEATRAWMNGEDSALDPTWYGLGFAAWLSDAARQPGGTMRAARALLDRALSSQDPVMRPAALRAIAASGRSDVARWVLKGPGDQRLRASEQLQMIATVASTTATREQGYGWVRGHLRQLLEGGGGIFFASRLPQVMAGFCSVAKAEDIEHDFGPALKGKTAELELERVVERVRRCGQLRDARGAEASAEIARLR